MIKGAMALVLCAFLAVIGASKVFAASEVVISKVQTTGCREYQLQDPSVCAIDNGTQEYIELTNTSSVDIDVTGWRVEYLSASSNGSGAPTRVLATLQGKLLAQSSMTASFEGYLQQADVYFGTPSSSGYLAKSGGHVRLVSSHGEVLDQLGWGSATQIANWPKITEIAAGNTVRRLFPGDPLYSPASPFIIVNNATIVVGGLQPIECDGVVLSEIVPNPTGVDGGNEFIELYNPTAETIQLSGCSVRVNNGHAFQFTDETIPPGGYWAILDTTLGFTLPNSSGATVWLITTDNEEGVQYPANMGEGEAWALSGSGWKLSASPTKGSENVIVQPGGKGGGAEMPLPCPAGKYRNPETNRCRSESAASSPLTPCKPGQTRNPETRRCRSALSVRTSLTACKVGQVRNPETNRCRSATTVSTTLTPCKSGQARNPETNRCRSTATASSVLKPCQPGQERNPETNRCRKTTTTAGGKEYAVEKVSAQGGAPLGWMVAGTAGAGVLGYGAFEWRREIGNLFGRIKDKIGGSPPA